MTTIIIPNRNVPVANVADAPIADRMRVLSMLNSQAGYHFMPETLVPVGTALIPMGQQKLRALRDRIDALPLLGDALHQVERAVAALDPVDVQDRVEHLRMREDGKLYRILADGKHGPAIGYNHVGLQQLVSMYAEALGIPRGMVPTLEWLRPKAASVAFNDLAERADSVARDIPDRIFRTVRNPNGERFLRAVVSPTHVGAAGGTGALVQLLKSKLGPRMGDARCRVIMTHDRTELEIFYPLYRREIVVGDVVMGRQRIVISETKDTSASVLEGLLRALCLNFTTAWYGAEEQFNRRHVGDGDRFMARIGEAFVGGLNRLMPFVQAFGDSYSKPLPATRAETLQRTVRALELPSNTASLAQQLWDADGSASAGDSLGGLVNALTRASQEMTLDQADEVEAAAGRLVVEGWAALEA